MIKQFLAYWTCSMCLVIGHGLGPSYKVSTQYCDRNDECNTATGQVCLKVYEGCDKGQCMCDPTKQIADAYGVCKTFRYGGKACTKDEICLNGMSCREGVCQCISGRMTSDGMFCLKDNQRLLGDTCDIATDKCLQKASSGYRQADAHCSYKGRCECNDGHKQVGVSCRKWKIGESGCTETYQCIGGSLCLRGKCRCPTAYDAVAGNTKCVKRGATKDLPISAICDEINERRYCGQNLVCNHCPNENVHKCVKYLISNDSTYLSVSPATRPSVLTVLSVVLSSVIWYSVYR